MSTKPYTRPFKEFVAVVCAFMGVPILASFLLAASMTLDHQDGSRWLWCSIILFAIAYAGSKWAEGDD